MSTFTQRLLETPPLATHLLDLKTHIVREVKFNSNFENGEALFHHLLKRLQLQDSQGRPAGVNNPEKPKYSRKNRPFGDSEISYFQRSLATMIRYSPNPDIGLKYASFFLNQIEPPLRDAETEITVLINLIYIYNKNGSDTYMKAGLDFVKIGLERGLPLYWVNKVERKGDFNDPGEVFSSVAAPILRYNNLQPRSDNMGFEKSCRFHSGGYRPK